MAKLFAFEEMEENMELTDKVEVSPEELEAVQELPVIQDEAEEVNQHSEAIDEAVEATDDLSEVQEVIEKSIEEEGGLSPVAAEAIRIAVESICARVGASPKTLFSLYAAENYKSSSARLANSKLALEGIGEFIRNLWERIKKSVKNLWEKVVAFWEKHISTLGRMSKVLDRLYEKVGSLTGTAEEQKVKAPSVLAKDFDWVAEIDANVIKDTIARHIEFTAKLSAFEKASVENKKAFKDMVEKFKPEELEQHKAKAEEFVKKLEELSFGSEEKPLVTGVYYEVEVELEKEDGELFSAFNIKREEAKEVEEHELKVLAVNEMRDLIKAAKVLVVKTMDVKKAVADAKKSLTETIASVDKLVEKVEKEAKEEHEEIKKQFKALVGIFSKFQASYARFMSDVISLNTRAANSVIVAVNASAKEYKKSK